MIRSTNHPSHPIYGLLKYIATLLMAAFAMYLFATEFDETEMKALAVFGTTLGVGEFIKSQIVKKKE